MVTRGNETRLIRLEERLGLLRRDWSRVDVSRLSDAELSRAIYEMTGISPAAQTDEVLEQLTGQAEAEAKFRARQ
jgi:hypothetical protein